MNVLTIKKQKTLVIVLLLFTSFLFLSYAENTSFFTINTSYVGIQDDNIGLQGLLYKPVGVSESNPAPGVVLAHGIANSKEVVSGYALELAKRGFVTLALDEIAHGNSGGNLITARSDEPSLGVNEAVNWLAKQSYVLSNSIGVVGHSMGAGAVLSASMNSNNIKSTILIGGGVNGTLTDSSGLNATNPHNLLIIIGKFDVLFNIPNLKNSDLKKVFNTTSEIQENTLYGSFTDSSARKLYSIPATHLFEVENPDAIATITNWLSESLNFTLSNQNTDYSSFLIRDISLIAAFAGFIVLLLLLSKIVLQKEIFTHKYGFSKTEKFFRGDFKLLGLTWGILSIVLFLPSIIIGQFIVFPPIIFGSIFTFWQLFTALIALICLFVFKKYRKVNFEFNNLFKPITNNLQYMYFAIVLFLSIYGIVILMEELLNLNFKLFIPVLNEIGTTDRIIIFLMVLPITLIYYFFQNIFFYNLSNYSDYKSIKTLLIQIGFLEGPFIIVLAIFYLPIFLTSTVLIQGVTGFFTEFLVPTTAVFITTTVINWYYYKETENITIGTILNALIVTLTISSLFPVVQTFF